MERRRRRKTIKGIKSRTSRYSNRSRRHATGTARGSRRCSRPRQWRTRSARWKPLKKMENTSKRQDKEKEKEGRGLKIQPLTTARRRSSRKNGKKARRWHNREMSPSGTSIAGHTSLCGIKSNQRTGAVPIDSQALVYIMRRQRSLGKTMARSSSRGRNRVL